MKKIICAFLAITVLLSLAGCNQSEKGDVTTTTTEAATTTTASNNYQELNPDGPIQYPDGDGENEGGDDGGSDADTDDEAEYCDLYIPYGSATVDGTREAAWSSAAKVKLDTVKTGNITNGVEVYASAMWDNNAIYFLFEISDPVICQTDSKGSYQNDGIYIYIAEDSKVSTSSFSDYTNGIYQFALINPQLELIPRKGVESELKGVQSAYTFTDTGMLIEFCYTPSIVPLASGNTLRLDYQYNDASSEGKRLGGIGWFNTTDTNTKTELWGYVKLLAEGEQAPKN